ncbi:MAG TPA: glycoside hydrolase family 15 protein [Pedococcus sp.]|jgi:GH15 family glucan-1,4-alpha-glucosidase|nr:glycoside hydrolase family 15 protein [Pedococcus sp.]
MAARGQGAEGLTGHAPIEDHGVIGDLHTAALVSTEGDIEWLCLPRFDSPSVFAALLDDERGGRFSVRCAGATRTKQMYLPDSNILVTRFLGESSVGEVVDFMVPRERNGRGALQLVRIVRAVRGQVRVQIRCAPAFDYGRARTEVDIVEGAGAFFSSPAGQLVLRSTVPLQAEGSAAVADPVLAEGELLALSLSRQGSTRPLDLVEAEDLLASTLAYWQHWIRKSRYRGRYREMVERSALALKLLVYQPTGALVAAATTSLPESVGGSRNWDYRFTWVRDAAFTVYALMRLGFSEEAAAFMDWLEARCTQTPPGAGLRILYTLDGGPVPAEESLEHLRGYRDSRPVRIGNGAADQLQLDIYGELMDSVYLYDRYAEPISYELWVALCRQLDWLEGHWEKADHGVWEVRGPMQRFTYSSVMTWVAFQRGARIAAERGLPAPLDRWRASADRAYLHVQEESWSPERKAYVQFPGSRTLDAGALVLPLVKFSGPRDPRFLATLDRIEQELVTDSLVHRYQNDGSDGFTEAEGTFNLCSFWYVEALTRAGRLDQARHTFEKMLTYANHLGLYAEEIGPSGEALGNFPQAFTHLALISAAVNLDLALDTGPVL